MDAGSLQDLVLVVVEPAEPREGVQPVQAVVSILACKHVDPSCSCLIRFGSNLAISLPSHSRCAN